MDVAKLLEIMQRPENNPFDLLASAKLIELIRAIKVEEGKDSHELICQVGSCFNLCARGHEVKRIVETLLHLCVDHGADDYGEAAVKILNCIYSARLFVERYAEKHGIVNIWEDANVSPEAIKDNWTMAKAACERVKRQSS